MIFASDLECFLGGLKHLHVDQNLLYVEHTQQEKVGRGEALPDLDGSVHVLSGGYTWCSIIIWP